MGGQVIVITHLAQIAAMAEHHLVVQKSAQEGRTICSVKVIDLDARREEVARRLGGLKITMKTRDHAAELLANNDHDIPKSLLYGR